MKCFQHTSDFNVSFLYFRPATPQPDKPQPPEHPSPLLLRTFAGKTPFPTSSLLLGQKEKLTFPLRASAAASSVFSGELPLPGLFPLCGRSDLRPLALSKGFQQIRMDPVFSRGSDGISMSGRLRSSHSLLSAVVVRESEEIHECLEHSSSTSTLCFPSRYVAHPSTLSAVSP